ncbi:MAG TPA: hypothetical protein VKB69_05885, partial [Micromonosporaceae bacterium]|nr:hypothetical protein [Micromonosporaceae bacterium]
MSEPATPTGATRAGTRLGLVLAVLGVVWLAAKLWAAYRQIRDGAGDSVVLASAALALPAVLQSTVLAGMGCGYAARQGMAGRAAGGDRAPLARWLAAPVGGLLVGAAAMAAIISVYGDVTSTVRIGATVAVAGLLGGVLAALPRTGAVTAAGLLAALGGFVLDTVLNSDTVLGGMMSAFGGRASATPDRI